ncbi:hypothetical protein MNBD_NITROSPINAE04-1707 [hydrothermal vent metagenome]|uniref:POTRA domain-containing protein n=1 Tax=hydrothermal vent metagenome TaxID=652676 RepID=A0A3B1BTC2_9ZZZZ
MRKRKNAKTGRKKRASRLKEALLRLNALAVAFVRIVLITTVFTLSAVGAYAGYEKVKTTDYFKITKVEIDGLTRVNELDLLQLLGNVKGKSVFEFDLGKAGKRLQTHPWIESVEIRRRLPATIRILAGERTPALIVVGSRRFLADRHGVILRAVGKDENPPYPLVTGIALDARPLRPGDQIDPGAIRDALKAIDKLTGYSLFGKSRLKSIDLSGEDRLVLRFEGSAVTVIAQRLDWTDGAQRLKTVDYILRGREKAVIQIDLFFPDKVIVTYPTNTQDQRG